MNDYANSLKQTPTSLIQGMSAAPAPYFKNPEKDFYSKKKPPFETVMQLLTSMGSNSFCRFDPFPKGGRSRAKSAVNQVNSHSCL
ncbi:hypothetical protein ACFFK0_19150 [Paenibacillus chartarius]|uniref:Uncharacterized protein n=1 Tax=Paenibacillus chartarius TaxID=747481 RepID=A0ABV6DPH9_9BACL